MRYLSALAREIATTRGLSHPNIVRYIGLSCDASREELHIFLEARASPRFPSLSSLFIALDVR